MIKDFAEYGVSSNFKVNRVNLVIRMWLKC